MRTINRMKLAALAKEFPLLTRLPYNIEDCQHVVIKRADEHEMERVPFQRQTRTEVGSWAKGDRVFLIGTEGQVLGEVKPTRYSIDYNRNGREEFQPGESVLDSIFRQQLHRAVHYIVWIRFGVDQLGDIVLPSWHAYIYKPDRTIPIDETLVNVYHEAEVEVQTEMRAAGF